MKNLKDISAPASEAFSALFGENCKNLTRENAQDLIQAAMRFVSEQGDIDWDEVFVAGEYPVPKNWGTKTKKIGQLSDNDMLGLVEFLTYHLRVGRWASTSQQIKHLAEQAKINYHIDLDIDFAEISVGGSSRQGNTDYILALLQRFDSESRQFPSQEDCFNSLNKFAEKLKKIETLTLDTENKINHQFYSVLPLTDEEFERCNKFLSKLKCNMADFQAFIESRIDIVEGENFD